MTSAKRRKIPGAKEWQGYDTDLDVQYAHKLLFGKAAADVVHLFSGGRCIERAGELLFMPRGAFHYYVFAFADYIRSPEAQGDADAGSVFLHLLVNREKKDPGSVKAIYSELREVARFVAENQEYFNASADIYGSFSERGEQLERLCNYDDPGERSGADV